MRDRNDRGAQQPHVLSWTASLMQAFRVLNRSLYAAPWQDTPRCTK
jgi:hypothetical protein